jgi:hypothetical protein
MPGSWNFALFGCREIFEVILMKALHFILPGAWQLLTILLHRKPTSAGK